MTMLQKKKYTKSLLSLAVTLALYGSVSAADAIVLEATTPGITFNEDKMYNLQPASQLDTVTMAQAGDAVLNLSNKSHVTFLVPSDLTIVSDKTGFQAIDASTLLVDIKGNLTLQGGKAAYANAGSHITIDDKGTGRTLTVQNTKKPAGEGVVATGDGSEVLLKAKRIAFESADGKLYAGRAVQGGHVVIGDRAYTDSIILGENGHLDVMAGGRMEVAATGNVQIGSFELQGSPNKSTSLQVHGDVSTLGTEKSVSTFGIYDGAQVALGDANTKENHILGRVVLRNSSLDITGQKINTIRATGTDVAVRLTPSVQTEVAQLRMVAPSNMISSPFYGIRNDGLGGQPGAEVTVTGRTEINAPMALHNLVYQAKGKPYAPGHVITRIVYDEDSVSDKKESMILGHAIAWGGGASVEIVPKSPKTEGYVTGAGMMVAGSLGLLHLELNRNSVWTGPISNSSRQPGSITNGSAIVGIDTGAKWVAGYIAGDRPVISILNILRNDGEVIISDGVNAPGGQRLLLQEANGSGTYTISLSKNVAKSDMLYIGVGSPQEKDMRLQLSLPSSTELQTQMQKGDHIRFATVVHRNKMFKDNSHVGVLASDSLTKPSFIIKGYLKKDDVYGIDGSKVPAGTGDDTQEVSFPTAAPAGSNGMLVTVVPDTISSSLPIIYNGQNVPETTENLYIVRDEDTAVDAVKQLPHWNASQYGIRIGTMDTFAKRGAYMHLDAMADGGIWTRFDNIRQERPNVFTNQHNILEMGYTWAIPRKDDGRQYRTVSASWNHYNSTLAEMQGQLTGKTWALHAYDTHMKGNSYQDWHVRLGHMHSNSEYVASDGSKLGATYGSYLGAVSWEYGVKCVAAHGWTYTPQLQTMYTYAPSVSWEYAGIGYHMLAVHSLLTRVGVVAEHTQHLTNGALGNFTIGLHFTREWVAQQETMMQDNNARYSYNTSMRGNEVSVSAGYQYRHTLGTLSAHVERAWGQHNTQSWNYNLSGSLFF